MRRLPTFLGLATAVLAASIGSSFAQSGRTQVGVLECRGGPNIGMVVGSVTNLGCVFRAQGRPDDLYTAQITKVGLDLGITEQTVLSWAVFFTHGSARHGRPVGQLRRRHRQRCSWRWPRS